MLDSQNCVSPDSIKTTEAKYWKPVGLPDVKLHPGEQLHGFEVKAVTPIEELRAVTIELAHQHSGARLLHIYTNDTENLFSINFPDPAIR